MRDLRDRNDLPLVPDRLDPPPVSNDITRPPRRWASRGLAMALILALLLGVIAVFTLLPRWVAPEPPADPTASAPSADTPSTVAEPTSAAPAAGILIPEPPEARAAAQDALAKLMPQIDTLRSQRVEEWGEAHYRTAEEALAAGEKAYREQRYTQAGNAFAETALAIAGLTARIPEVVTDYLDTGERALLSHDPRRAETAFSQALALAPDNSSAERGLRRAEAFDQVMALLTQAKGHERLDELSRAAEAYRAALKLDPEAAEARLALTRIETAQADSRFLDTMSGGFRALENENYTEARAAFAAAVKQKPRSREAANALAQTEARAAAAKIEAALAAAARAERAEQWPEAAAQFRAALAIDKTLAIASAGAARAAQRAALARQLDETLKDPSRFADAAVYREAETVLNAALTIASPGPKLAQHIATLKAQLKAAHTTIPVRVVSDGTTDVTIQKFGRLGSFTEQTLSLYPGRYTALGKRNGYRDARIEFTVAADAAPPTITVQCHDELSFRR